MTRWSPASIPDQTGRTALVTGASSGLGLHTCLELARKGARVLLAVRSPDKGEQALSRIRREVPGALAEPVRLDLASLASVRAAADDVAARVDRLDVLVDNAGVMAVPRSLTEDGFERQLGTNHLGHVALTGLLLPQLLAAAAPRVVVVSSSAHRSGRIRLDDLQGERSYSRWGAYGQSKLANLLFARDGSGAAPPRRTTAWPSCSGTPRWTSPASGTTPSTRRSAARPRVASRAVARTRVSPCGAGPPR